MLINNQPMEFTNIYTPNKVEAPAFLTTHLALRESFLAGDFNAHYSNWYREKVVEMKSVLSASRQQADMLVKWTSELQFIRMNTLGTPTHYPRRQ